MGLPRSRTAWLANFMTYEGHYCAHDGLNGYRSLEEYKSSFSDFSGDSNTGLALFDFEHLFTDFKIVIIDNDIDSVVAFTKTHYGSDITEVMNRLKLRLDGLTGLHVPFAEINNRLEAIWDHLSNKQFDKRRADMLARFNVQEMDGYPFDEKAMTVLRENTRNYFT